MSIYAISDLHLLSEGTKPMDIFGGNWLGYMDKIKDDWRARVTADDMVLLGGDLSWAMTLGSAQKDIEEIAELPGKKIMIRGNHDYWWSSVSKIRAILPFNFSAIQNDSIKTSGAVICGCRGWTVYEEGMTEHDKAVYLREAIRMELALKSAASMLSSGDDLIVLMHYPPFNVQRADSKFTELFHRYGVSKVVYGHLHGKNCRSDLYLKMGGVEYYLTSCDMAGNKLTLIKP